MQGVARDGRVGKNKRMREEEGEGMGECGKTKSMRWLEQPMPVCSAGLPIPGCL